MNKILMISIKTLKDNYLIDDNLDDKYLLPVIQKAQDFLLIPLLGQSEYDSIAEGINTNNLTDEQKVLLDKIEPMLAYYVLSEVVYSTAYKLKNKGISDDGYGERFNELVRISKKYLLDSQHYQQLLETHYNRSCKSRISTVYKSGLYLG